MAEVFLAKSFGLQGFEKIVAIKRILPSVSEDSDFTTMFIDEAKISANLNHANIGQVFEFGQVNGQYYIAMEYIPGRDLRTIHGHLADTGRVMELPAVLHIGTRICQALDYAHRQKNTAGANMDIVHRDVSPPNVIISFDGAVKLIDFGIAKAASRATRTRAGKLKGKFSYMSPEQVQGLPVDRRSDIFSLGVLLYELLAGRRLFHGENQLATLNLVRRAEVTPISALNPEIPLEVDRILLRALARDREQRYGWATEMRADIERFLARTGIVYDSQQLAEWMRSEFPGEIEAERLLRERMHRLRLEDVAEETAGSGRGEPAGDDAAPSQRRRSAEWEAVTPGPPRPIATTPLPALVDAHDEVTVSGLTSEAREALAASALPVVSPQPQALPPLPAQPFLPATEEVEENACDAATAVSLAPHHPADGEELPPTTQLPSLARLPDSDPLLGERTDPRVFGPASAKDDNPLAHLPTMHQSAEVLLPSTHPMPGPGPMDAVGAIAPGPDRHMAAVEGALEVATHPEPAALPIAEEAVDLTALGAAGVVSHQRPADPASVSGTRQVGAPGWTRMKVTVVAGCATLVLAAVIFTVLALGSAGRDTDGGSVLVSASPRATCSVSLGSSPKGLLPPGGTLTLHGISPGRHLISLQCLGFLPYSAAVEVKAGEPTIVVARLSKR